METIDWTAVSDVGPAAAAVLNGLQFGPDSTHALPLLDDNRWREALAFADRSQVTLLLAGQSRCRPPDWVSERLARDRTKNKLRIDALKREYRAIATTLQALGIDHVLLKGMQQAPEFIPDEIVRAQYDIDILCARQDAMRAVEVIRGLGFESAAGADDLPTDHLRPLVRKTGWRWRGDYFDPEIPPVIEVHFRPWDRETEGFEVAAADEFWQRRTYRISEGSHVPVFALADRLGYSALHALRHLLRGNLKAFHVWEIAYFLERRADDTAFWDEWRDIHPAPLRGLEAIAFSLAAKWFGCRRGEADEECAGLDHRIRTWLDGFATSPVRSLFRPNKDEIWLNLLLAEEGRMRRKILRRKLFPLLLPDHVDGIFVSREQMTLRVLAVKWIRYGRFLGNRLMFHAGSLVQIARSGLRLRRALRSGVR